MKCHTWLVKGEQERLWKGENIETTTLKNTELKKQTRFFDNDVNLVGIDSKSFKSLEYELYTFDTVLRVFMPGRRDGMKEG